MIKVDIESIPPMAANFAVDIDSIPPPNFAVDIDSIPPPPEEKRSYGVGGSYAPTTREKVKKLLEIASLGEPQRKKLAELIQQGIIPPPGADYNKETGEYVPREAVKWYDPIRGAGKVAEGIGGFIPQMLVHPEGIPKMGVDIAKGVGEAYKTLLQSQPFIGGRPNPLFDPAASVRVLQDPVGTGVMAALPFAGIKGIKKTLKGKAKITPKVEEIQAKPPPEVKTEEFVKTPELENLPPSEAPKAEVAKAVPEVEMPEVIELAPKAEEIKVKPKFTSPESVKPIKGIIDEIQWDKIKKEYGLSSGADPWITQETNIAKLAEKVSNAQVHIKDVNGYRARIPITEFAELSKYEPFTDRIRQAAVYLKETPDRMIQQGFMSNLLEKGKFKQITGDIIDIKPIKVEGIDYINNAPKSVSKFQQVSIIRALSDEGLARHLKESGIRKLIIDPPYKFELSEQGNLSKDGKTLSINADVIDPLQTIRHELGHIKWKKISNAERQSAIIQLKTYVNNPDIAGYMKLGKYEEAYSESVLNYPDLVKAVEVPKAEVTELAPKTEELKLSGGLGAVADIDYNAAKTYFKGKVKQERKPQDVRILGRSIGTPTHTFRAIPGMPGFENPTSLELTWVSLEKPQGALKELLKQRTNLPYGRAAQLAHQFAAAKEIIIRRDTGIDREIYNKAIAKIEKVDWGKDGSRAYEHVVDPTRDSELSGSSLEGIREIRESMETHKGIIIDNFRNDLRPSISKIINKTWRAENELKGKVLTPEQKAKLDLAIEDKLAELVSDDWGIKNYLPQMHPGDYEIIAIDNAGNSHWLSTARTPWEAFKKITEHFVENMADFTENSYEIKARVFKGNLDVVRVGRRRYYKVINEIAKSAKEVVSKEEIRNYLRGVVGAKEAKRKFAGFLQHRKGFAGFEKKLDKVLAVNAYQFNKWNHIRRMNEVFEPLIKETRNSGRPIAAQMIEKTRDILSGTYQSPVSSAVDASIQGIPVLRDFIAPRFLDRSLNHIKSTLATLFIRLSPRFNWFTNPTQKYVTGRSLMHGSEWSEGVKFFKSPEGKDAMERHGVKYLTGGKITEATRAISSPNIREKTGILASETRNQEVMWSVMYQKAKKLGRTDQEAANYAYLRGNLYSQFLPLSVDMPPAFRGAVASSTYGFFRRFPVKNMELGVDFLRSKDVSGGLRWLGYQLALAGPRLVTKPIGVIPIASYLTYKGYKTLRSELEDKFGKEVGKRTADVIAYGLPALLGMDMYYSFEFWNIPYGRSLNEKIGNLMLGPLGGIGTGAWNDYTDLKGFEPSAARRVAKGIAERFPSLRWVGAIRAMGNKLDSGEYNFTDAAGRVKFKADLQDIIVRAIGGRTVKEADVDMIIENMMNIQAERDKVLDQTVMELIQAEEKGLEYDYKAVNDFNELWMDAGVEIDMDAINTRKKSRLEDREKTKLERIKQNIPKSIRESEAFQ